MYGASVRGSVVDNPDFRRVLGGWRDPPHSRTGSTSVTGMFLWRGPDALPVIFLPTHRFPCLPNDLAVLYKGGVLALTDLIAGTPQSAPLGGDFQEHGDG
jgi:hypothetical protein